MQIGGPAVNGYAIGAARRGRYHRPLKERGAGHAAPPGPQLPRPSFPSSVIGQ